MPFQCRLCDCTEFDPAYRGKIRIGRFGRLSQEDYLLPQCNGCGVIALPTVADDLDDYYKSGDYRTEVDGGAEIDHFFQMHDGEQLRNLGLLGTGGLRGKTLADVGCGGGAFLDTVKGFVETAIAIEPSRVFQHSLCERGYAVYDYAANCSGDFADAVDIITSFSVIEHIPDPLEFLLDIRKLLKPGGRLVVSTPNAGDILLSLLPDCYPSFFYRKVHLWYFNAESLEKLLKKAGFDDVTVTPFHRFGLSNCLNWLNQKRPMGDNGLPCISPALNDLWKRELSRQGVSDYLMVEAFCR